MFCCAPYEVTALSVSQPLLSLGTALAHIVEQASQPGSPLYLHSAEAASSLDDSWLYDGDSAYGETEATVESSHHFALIHTSFELIAYYFAYYDSG